MTEGVMTLWFILTGLSLAYVSLDIRSTPEATVLKWAFVILVAFTGPLGAFFYVLGVSRTASRYSRAVCGGTVEAGSGLNYALRRR